VKGFKRFQLTFGSIIYDEYWDKDKVKFNTNVTFIHPNYTLVPIRNDIALIKLPEKIEFSETVKPISLPKSENMNRTLAGQKVLATGYGKQKDKSGGAKFLQYAYLEVISEEECQKTYENELDATDFVCARGINLESVCLGDSGRFESF
jgi:hypothetical protein